MSTQVYEFQGVSAKYRKATMITAQILRARRENTMLIQGLTPLDCKAGVYVPSKQGQRRIPRGVRNAALERVQASLCGLFGGSTTTPAKGGWLSDTDGYVEERVDVVCSYATREAIARHAQALVGIAQRLREDLSQESVAIEVDGSLYLVEETEGTP